jgi:hypothetical protein
MEEMIVRAKLRRALVVSPDKINLVGRRIQVAPLFSLDALAADLQADIRSGAQLDSIYLPPSPQRQIARESFAPISQIHTIGAKLLADCPKLARLSPEAIAYVMRMLARYFGA